MQESEFSILKDKGLFTDELVVVYQKKNLEYNTYYLAKYIKKHSWNHILSCGTFLICALILSIFLPPIESNLPNNASIPKKRSYSLNKFFFIPLLLGTITLGITLKYKEDEMEKERELLTSCLIKRLNQEFPNDIKIGHLFQNTNIKQHYQGHTFFIF